MKIKFKENKKGPVSRAFFLLNLLRENKF